jgi:hypothetical protein
MNQTKPEFRLTLEATVSRDQMAALPITDQASLAYDLFGAVADKLTECGIAPDLVAGSACDLATTLARLDGSPRRVARLRGTFISDTDAT